MAVSEPVAETRSRFSPASLAERRGVHYGWVMVGVTFLLVTVTAGIRSAPGVMITPLKHQYGWSTGEISLAISLSILTLGLAGPISGKLIDRHGIRPVIIGFLVIGCLGVIATFTLHSLWQFYVYWGLLVGFGAGGTSIVLSATVANTWFFEKRGLVTGILGGAASAGQLVFILLLAVIVDAWGWRQAVGLMAIIATVIAMPLAVVLLQSRPKDVGLLAYGARPGQVPLASDERLVPMKEALRSGDFWLIALSFGVCGFTTIGLIGTHFIPHATEHGYTEKQAAGILSVIGAFNVVGTIASGWLTDRYSPRKLLALYYFLRAISLLVLPAISGVPLMSAFAVVFGLDYIATVPPTVMLTANRFGRRSVGTIYGWITFSHMVGGSIAAALAGYIHDAAGDYGYAMYLGGFLALLAAGLAFNIGARPPKVAGLTPAAGY
ncbi:MAG: MFS transporter [bacterium]